MNCAGVCGADLRVDTGALQTYLHRNIPLSQAMGVEVRQAGPDLVALEAPLAPNINHRETVFGGSASAVAILSAWALLYLRLQQQQLNARIVIQKHTMNYERPIPGRFTASSTIEDEASWLRFLDTLRRRRRARIRVTARLHSEGTKVGELEGEFVALAPPLT